MLLWLGLLCGPAEREGVGLVFSLFSDYTKLVCFIGRVSSEGCCTHNSAWVWVSYCSGSHPGLVVYRWSTFLVVRAPVWSVEREGVRLVYLVISQMFSVLHKAGDTGIGGNALAFYRDWRRTPASVWVKSYNWLITQCVSSLRVQVWLRLGLLCAADYLLLSLNLFCWHKLRILRRNYLSGRMPLRREGTMPVPTDRSSSLHAWGSFRV